MRIEISHHIPNFPNYQIISDGRVRNIKTNKILKANPSTSGYLQVNLIHNNIRKTRSIHRLLGEAFIPNPYNKPQIDHINRDRIDDRLCNLRWVTLEEQAQNKVMFHKLLRNNVLGERYIGKVGNGYKCRIINKHVKVERKFKTLTEAIAFRDKTIKTQLFLAKRKKEEMEMSKKAVK